VTNLLCNITQENNNATLTKHGYFLKENSSSLSQEHMHRTLRHVMLRAKDSLVPITFSNQHRSLNLSKNVQGIDKHSSLNPCDQETL